MTDLVPEEARTAAREALAHTAADTLDVVALADATVRAAAPLILAAWLDRHAKRMDDAATGRVSKDSWDRGWHAAWISSADALRAEAESLRASVLRGEGDPK